MSAPELASAVAERRKELDLPQQLDRYGGPDETAVAEIERGEGPSDDATLRRLDAVLHWRFGSARNCLESGEPPEPLKPPAAASAPAAITGPPPGPPDAPTATTAVVPSADDALALRIGRVVLALIRDANPMAGPVLAAPHGATTRTHPMSVAAVPDPISLPGEADDA